MKNILRNTLIVTFIIAFAASGCGEARYCRSNRSRKPDFGTRYNDDQPVEVGMGIKIYN
jgi:hypothetical protein